MVVTAKVWLVDSISFVARRCLALEEGRRTADQQQAGSHLQQQRPFIQAGAAGCYKVMYSWAG